MDSFRDHLVEIGRRWRRRPGHPALVAATLALALAAVGLLAAVLRAVVLDPLPFREPGSLVALWGGELTTGQKDRVRARDFLVWRDEPGLLAETALFSWSPTVVGPPEEPVEVAGSAVSEGWFDLLGVAAVRGRLFEPGDHGADAPPVAVVSHRMWTDQLGGDPGVVGSTLLLDGEPTTVVGVLRPGIVPLVAWHSGRLEVGEGPFVWRPQDPRRLHPGSGVHGVVARLPAGLSPEGLQARFAELVERERTRRPGEVGEDEIVRVVPLAEEVHGDVGPLLLLLSAAIGLLLCGATADLAVLALLRHESGRNEQAVRLALGASPGRLRLRQLLEAAGLGALGGLAGLGLARLALGPLVAWTPTDVPRLGDAHVGSGLGGALVALGVVCALVATLATFLRPGRAPLVEVTRSGRSLGPSGRGLQRVLVGAQTALAVVLLLGAGLLVRSLRALESTDPGFDRASVLTVRISPRGAELDDRERLVGFWEDLLAEVGALSGVLAAAAAYDPPSETNWTQSFRIDDVVDSAAFRTVTPGYFEALGVDLLEGRTLGPGDRADTAGAVVVNRAFVRRFFPDGAALGRRLRVGTTHWRWGEDAIPSEMTVVGVVADVRFRGLAAPPEPAFYIPYRQTPHTAMTLLVRTDVAPAALLGPIREVVARRAPGTPLGEVATLEAALDAQVAAPRFGAGTLVAFGAGALLLAALGLWGVLDASMRERRREVGVRVALGARPRQVLSWALAHGLGPAALGGLLGLLAAMPLRRLVASQLVGVSTLDPAAWAAAVAVVGVGALAACLSPALRAVGVEPAEALRAE